MGNTIANEEIIPIKALDGQTVHTESMMTTVNREHETKHFEYAKGQTCVEIKRPKSVDVTFSLMIL